MFNVKERFVRDWTLVFCRGGLCRGAGNFWGCFKYIVLEDVGRVFCLFDDWKVKGYLVMFFLGKIFL